jgi:hypothetical protein
MDFRLSYLLPTLPIPLAPSISTPYIPITSGMSLKEKEFKRRMQAPLLKLYNS